MAWGEGPGYLPPLHEIDGVSLVQLVAQAQVHHIVGADELDHSGAQDCWHEFADLMRDAADSAVELDEEDRAVLGQQLERSIRELRQVKARVLAALAGAVLYVAVVPRGWRRDTRLLFARG